jgi:hypothetical protein
LAAGRRLTYCRSYDHEGELKVYCEFVGQTNGVFPKSAISGRRIFPQAAEMRYLRVVDGELNLR